MLPHFFGPMIKRLSRGGTATVQPGNKNRQLCSYQMIIHYEKGEGKWERKNHGLFLQRFL